MARQYEVIGPRKVHGHLRGERFWADIAPEIETALLGVHLAIVDDDAPTPRPRARLIHHFPAGTRYGAIEQEET